MWAFVGSQKGESVSILRSSYLLWRAVYELLVPVPGNRVGKIMIHVLNSMGQMNNHGKKQ